MRFAQVAVDAAVEFLIGLVVGSQQDVAIAETYLLCLFIKLKAVRHVTDGYVGFAPSEEYGSIEEERYDEVDQHAAQHDQQALPSGFGAKLPRLHGLFHLLRVHRLVNHARNLHIAS